MLVGKILFDVGRKITVVDVSLKISLVVVNQKNPYQNYQYLYF